MSESRKQRGTRRNARAAGASKIFSGAGLRAARFENTSLRHCDFSATHLLDTQFLGCDRESPKPPPGGEGNTRG